MLATTTRGRRWRGWLLTNKAVLWESDRQGLERYHNLGSSAAPAKTRKDIVFPFPFVNIRQEVVEVQFVRINIELGNEFYPY